MAVESTTYAKVRDDESHGWLLMMDYATAIHDMDALQWEDWDYLPRVEDEGCSVEYVDYMQSHPFP